MISELGIDTKLYMWFTFMLELDTHSWAPCAVFLRHAHSRSSSDPLVNSRESHTLLSRSYTSLEPQEGKVKIIQVRRSNMCTWIVEGIRVSVSAHKGLIRNTAYQDEFIFFNLCCETVLREWYRKPATLHGNRGLEFKDKRAQRPITIH